MSNPIAGVKTKPVTAYHSSPKLSKTEPTPTSSAVSPPPPQENTPTEQVIATINFEDGSVARITEKDLNVDPALPHFTWLYIRYKTLAQKMMEAKGEKSIVDFSIEDPALKILYFMDLALENNFPQQTVVEIENNIRQLSDKNKDKPYLLIMFAKAMLAGRKIKKEHAEKLVEEAVALAPQDQEIIYQAYQFYIGIQNLEKAQNALNAVLRLTPNDPGLMLELGRFFLLKSELAKNGKKYDEALSYLNLAEEAFQAVSQQKTELRTLLLEVSYRKAEILFLKGEKVAAFDLLLSLLEECKKQIKENPENAELYFRLASNYLALFKIKKNTNHGILLSRSQKITKYFKNSPPTSSDFRRLMREWKTDALRALEKAREYSQDNPALLASIADAYLGLREVKETLELYRELAQKQPENAIFQLKLGDLLLSQGEVTESFKYFEKVLAIAEKSKDPNLITEVYLRFSLLKTQAQLALIKKEVDRPTFLTASLNLLGTALLTYLNPFLGIANLIGVGLNAALSKTFTEEELREIMKKAAALEERVFSLVESQEDPVVFFMIAEATLSRANAMLQQIKELDKGLVKEDEIKAYRKIAEDLKAQAIKIMEAILKKCFSVSSFDNQVEIAQKYFLFYFFLAERSKDENLEDLIREKIKQLREETFNSAIAALKEVIRSSRKTRDAELAFAVFQVSGQILDRTKSKKKQEKLREISIEALKAVIEIAKENQDLDTLIELGKGIYVIGPFAQKALEEAITLAATDNDKLFEIGEVICELWRQEEKDDLVRSSEAKKILRNLGIIVYKKILETAQGEEKIIACRQLWILGDYLDAYLGYVSLVNDYKAKNDQDMLAKLFYELGLMATARGEVKKAVEWLTRALNASKDPLRKETIEFELQYLKSGTVPEHFSVKGNTCLSPQQIRASLILYATWANGHPTPKLLQQAAEDLYSANQKRAKISLQIVDGKIELAISEQTIDAIEISGNKSTKTETILRELGYAGLAPGTILPTDLSELSAPLSEASNRLRTFLVKDVKVKTKDGKTVLIIEVEEPIMWKLNLGGGAGNAQAFVEISLGYNNLFGGGEQIGLDLSYHWFYAEGFSHFRAWQGKLYYFDPHLFVLGKATPVSGGFELQYQPRMNYESGVLEKMLGGSITLGIKIAPGTTLALSPQFYLVQGSSRYYEPSLRISLTKDGRDNWLFPHSGYYLSASITPGVYIMEHGNQSFFHNENEARFYIPLPYEMTLAMRGVIGVGYGLLGGSKFALGGDMLNPYVRAAEGRPTLGLGILAGGLELRAPVIDLKYTKVQFYGFGDVGMVMGGGVLFGVGGGVRVLLPALGLINIGYGFPGGFFIWFGNLGWN